MHHFEQRFGENWCPEDWQDLTVLVGVSGGPDSMALLRAMLATRRPAEGRIVVGHFQHGLRDEGADTDAEFVASACLALGVPCETTRAEPPIAADRPGGSLEEAARTARYHFLRSLAERIGARYIVTGHTADDQAETVLHHILRGTGLRGLGGMRRSRAVGTGLSLIRPLLPFRRSEVVAYLQAIDQPFREDLTNRDTNFTRNRLRHDLIPQLARQYNPAVVDALLRLGRTARDARGALSPLLSKLVKEVVQVETDATIAVDCCSLARHAPHLVRELFVSVWEQQGWPQQAMTFAKWEELAELTAAEPPAGIDQRVFPGGIVVRREAGKLRLSPQKKPRPA